MKILFRKKKRERAETLPFLEVIPVQKPAASRTDLSLLTREQYFTNMLPVNVQSEIKTEIRK